MNSSVSLKCMLNREYLPANKGGIIFLSVDILPSQAAEGAKGLASAICLLIDRSGSMRGEKLEQVKAAACQLLDQLHPADYVGMVTFAGKIDKVASVDQVGSFDMPALKERIRRLDAKGWTELYRGLETSYEQLLSTSGAAENLVKRVILLSDGQPTDDVTNAEYANLARGMRESGISVVTLGIGSDYNEDLLGTIAENSGGIWKHISSPEEIPHIFSQQLEETRTVILTMPDILMHLSKDVELKDVYKAVPEVYPVVNMKRSGAEVRIPLSDIKAGEPQTLAARLNVPARPEGQCRLARVEIAGEPESQTDVIATYTNDERLCGIENEAFPRGIFLAAETQVLTRKGLSGDETALKQAEQMRDTILRDPNLTKIRTIQDTVVKAGETIVKAKTGMTEEETKLAKHGMTEIKRR